MSKGGELRVRTGARVQHMLMTCPSYEMPMKCLCRVFYVFIIKFERITGLKLKPNKTELIPINVTYNELQDYNYKLQNKSITKSAGRTVRFLGHYIKYDENTRATSLEKVLI